MSVNSPLNLTDPKERNISAAEYALGTLTTAERREVESAAEANKVLQHEIARWERRFALLGLRLKPVAPRPIVWIDLAHKTGVGAGATSGAKGGVLWKAWAGLATAATLVLAVGLYRESNKPAPKPVVQQVEVPVSVSSYVALLTVPKSTMAWSVSLTPERKFLSVRASGAAPAPAAHKDAQLWWIAEPHPVSLGVIPTTGEFSGTLPPGPDYSRGGTIAISLEPRGGSPDPGGPTGPVITSAQLLKAG